MPGGLVRRSRAVRVRSKMPWRGNFSSAPHSRLRQAQWPNVARGCNLATKSARPGKGTGAVVAGLGAGAVPVASGEGCESEGLLEGLGGAEPDGGLGSLARREEGDGRDAHDPVLHRRLRIGVD